MPAILIIDDNASVGTALDVLFSLHDIDTLLAQSRPKGWRCWSHRRSTW